MSGGIGEVEAVEASAFRFSIDREDGESVVWRVWSASAAERNAPLLLLLHGSFGSWTHWLRNIPALASVATVVAVDVPGFGDSGRAPPECEPERMGRELANAWDRLCREHPELHAQDRPFIMAGFSLGAIYAGWMAHAMTSDAALQPGSSRRPAGLILVAPGGLGSRPRQGFPLQRVPRDAGESARQQAHRHNLGVIMIADPAHIDATAVSIQDANVGKTTFRGPYAREPNALSRALQDLDLPILGIWGDADAFDVDVNVRIEAVRQLAPQLQAAVVEQAGHWVMYESAELCNKTIIQWIRKIIP